MSSGIYRFVCKQGATLSRMLTLKEGETARDLTGFHAQLQVRKTASSPVKLLEIGSEAPLTGITISGPQGQLAIDVDEALTLPMPAGEWVYDLFLIDGDDNVVPLLNGPFVVQAGVIR